jgi:hypothetical protein
MESDAQFHVECIKTNFVCPSRSESSTSLGGNGEDKHFCDWHVPEQLCGVLKEESFRNLRETLFILHFYVIKVTYFDTELRPRPFSAKIDTSKDGEVCVKLPELNRSVV